MPVISSEGRLLAIERPQAPLTWSPPGTVRLFEGLYADYAAIWRTQPSVRTVVEFLARNIAQLPIKVYRRHSDSDREHLREHGASRTLRRPNDFMTAYRLMFATVQSIGIYDAALWAKIRGEDGTVQLQLIPWSRVTIAGDNWIAPDHFIVTGSKGSVELALNEVVYFAGFSPTDPRQGTSPIETLRRLLAEDIAAGRYRENFWRNAARSDVALTRPADAPQWSDAARERFGAQFKAAKSGTANAGSTVILEDGMDVKPWPDHSAKDAQYLEARKLSREEVASAYHVSPAMIGILEHANFANIEMQHRMLYQDTLGPWLEMIQQELELQLLPEFTDTDDVYVEFNIADKLKGSFEEQMKALQTAVGAPWMLRKEARALMNLPPIEGDDGLVTPLNVLVGGQASPNDSAPKAQVRRLRAAPEE